MVPRTGNLAGTMQDTSRTYGALQSASSLVPKLPGRSAFFTGVNIEVVEEPLFKKAVTIDP